jgi:hypothetical protein
MSHHVQLIITATLAPKVGLILAGTSCIFGRSNYSAKLKPDQAPLNATFSGSDADFGYLYFKKWRANMTGYAKVWPDNCMLVLA